MSTPTPAAAVSAEPVVVTPGASRPNPTAPSVDRSTSIPITPARLPDAPTAAPSAPAFVAVVSVELAVVVPAVPPPDFTRLGVT